MSNVLSYKHLQGHAVEGLPDLPASCIMREKIGRDDNDGYSCRGLSGEGVHFKPAEQLQRSRNPGNIKHLPWYQT